MDHNPNSQGAPPPVVRRHGSQWALPPHHARGRRRAWVHVDIGTGASEAVEVAKPALMRRLDLPARDLRLLDPLFVYPFVILGCERVVVYMLERIRCIITADEALILRDPDVAGGGAETEEAVRRYVVELQRCLVDRTDDLPFALEAACSFLDAQVPLHII